MTNQDLASHFAESARVMTQARTLEETLQTIVEAARRSLPGFDAVGISTVDRKGKPQTRAKTDDLVDLLDDLQYGMGEGPCAETIKGADVVVAPHIRHDQRWPHYVPQAVRQGLRSQLAVRLHLEEGTIGGLNFYSTVSDEIDAEAGSVILQFKPALKPTVLNGLGLERSAGGKP